MRDIHLSREILSAVAKGELPPRTIVQIGIDHLRCLCPTCNSEWSAWEKERRGEGAGSFAERSPLSPEAEQPEVAAEREAARDFRRLGRLAPRERR
ncbi:MAG TPA: hypothetical protein VN783_13505, partial [Thermoanaerobaculia bacterium]|nr:hypothetical protein [Thermoanaerobaculia bacterium]